MRLESPSCWYSFCFLQLILHAVGTAQFHSFMCSSCSTCFRCAQYLFGSCMMDALSSFVPTMVFGLQSFQPSILLQPTRDNVLCSLLLFNSTLVPHMLNCFDPVAVMSFKETTLPFAFAMIRDTLCLGEKYWVKRPVLCFLVQHWLLQFLFSLHLLSSPFSSPFNNFCSKVIFADQPYMLTVSVQFSCTTHLFLDYRLLTLKVWWG